MRGMSDCYNFLFHFETELSISNNSNTNNSCNSMKYCIVNVHGIRYVGLFSSTCDAVSYTMARFPQATKISARAVRRSTPAQGCVNTPSHAHRPACVRSAQEEVPKQKTS